MRLVMVVCLIAVTAAGAHADSIGGVRRPVTRQEEPRLVHFEEPVYPPAARAAEIEADVFVPVYVNAKGEVYWTATQDKSAFYEAAVAAVRKWRYEPSKHVARSFSAKVRFRLPHKPVHRLSTVALLDQWSGEHAGRAEAARELTDRGVSILPALARELKADDLQRRCSAGHWIAPLGTAARKTAPALVDLVREVAARDENTGWCPGMGSALARVDHAAFAAELGRAVSGGDPGLCRILLREQRYKDTAPPAVLAALQLDGCREEAAWAISSLADAAALGPLLHATRNAHPRVRGAALDAVVRTVSGLAGDERRQRIAESLPFLVAGLSDPDMAVRYSAAMGFATLGAEASAGISALVRALDDPTRDIRWRVLLALTAMGSAARSAGPALLKSLESPLPPERDARTGLTDERMRELLQAAVVATGAGKDDAQLAADDDVYAAVVAHLVTGSGGRQSGATSFAVAVPTGRPSPRLLHALAARGLEPVADGVRPRVTVRLGAIVWRAGDLAVAEVHTDYGMSGGMGGCNVAREAEEWRVISCPMGSWN